jgi:DNA-binding XRE family transcriptional regulator
MHNRLHVLRAEKRASRRELADAVGVNVQTIGSIERGDYGPSLELALKIAQFFDVPIEVLFSLRPFPPLTRRLSNDTSDSEE